MQAHTIAGALVQCPCSGSDGGFAALTLLMMAAVMGLIVWRVRRWSEQGVSFMNKAGKIGIVAALVIVVAVILASKKGNSGSEKQPAPAASETSQDLASQSLTRLPRLVDLGAGKCIPCKMMAPILEELKRDYAGGLEVIFIDVWEHPNESEEYGIRLIPTQIFYDVSGRELFRHEGFISKEDILAKWKELGVQLQPAAKNGG